jgi:hypothetical protein
MRLPRFRRRPKLVLLFALAVTAAAPTAAQASDWLDGDVFVGQSTGAFAIFANDGTLKDTITIGGGITGSCAFNNSGVLHFASEGGDEIARFRTPHPHVRETDLINAGDRPQSVAFARDGSLFVGSDPSISGPSLRKFASGGSTTPRILDPEHSASLIDLASDQRTLFYTSQGSTGTTAIHRYDVVAETDLPDLVDLGTPALGDLKLLSPGDGSGGLIVAHDTTIKRLSSTGAVVKTYDAPGMDNWHGIALDPDGRSFWAQNSTPGNVFRFNIETGAVDRGPLPTAQRAFGICVQGTRTAALDNAPPRVSIASPLGSATFTQGEDVRASFSCADDANGTGIASCAGTVANGQRIATGTVGPQTFQVTARDNAGNTASRTVAYTVAAPPPPPPPPPPAAPTAPPAPPALTAPPLERIQVTLSSDFDDPGRRTTKLTRLDVKDIPRGSTLRVTCDPPGARACPARALTRRDVRGTVKLRTFRKAFRAGTVIQARVTKPNAVGAVKLLTIRAGKRPAFATRCLPPGASRFQRCA